MAKEYDFIVTLKPSGYGAVNIISIILCLLAIIVSLPDLMYEIVSGAQWLSLLLDILIGGYLLYSFFTLKKNPLFSFRVPLSAGAIIWFLPTQSNLIIALLYVIAVFFERQVKLPREIGFKTDTVTINSFPSKNYAWNQVANVILKDNVLTLDLKNNRIIQRETESDVDMETEKEFNEFCRLQMASIHK